MFKRKFNNLKFIKKYFQFGLIITISFLIILALFVHPIPSSAVSNNDILENDGIVRPQSIDEGLSRKTFSEMQGRRVTIREPYMEVLDRNIERSKTQDLSDIFTFVDPNTNQPYQGEGKELAYIDFSKEGNLNSTEENVLGDLKHPRYPMRGLDKGERKYFSDFVKYMLLRQSWFYRTQSMVDINNGELKKHPAADYIYGHIDDNAKAVKKLIISDPIYRSPMTTGLYLAPGEVATVTVKGLKEGEKIKLTTHQQDSLGYDGGFSDNFNPNTDPSYSKLSSTEKYFRYWDLKLIEEAANASKEGRKANYTQFDFSLQGQWKWQNQKVPCMGSVFEISNGTQQIGSIYGGPLYLQPTSSAVEIEISGALETPHYILGVTTKAEFENNLRNAPGLIATLDVENGQLIGLANYMQECDDIEKLAYFWHSVFAINSSLNGRSYNYNITMSYDIHVPAGEAVALNSSFCAQPYGWFKTCMNYEDLTTKGNWGTFHELGHVQAKTYGVNWGMCNSTCKEPCEGEVWNNTLIVLMYSLLCNMDPRMTTIEHGEFVYPYTAVERSMNVQDVEDYHDFNNTKGAHFDQLSLYATLIHSFGPSRFVDFFYSYKINKSYCPESRADFIYRMGLINHVNLFNWINENYHGNVQESSFTPEQWHYLQTLPDFYPIAYRYSNGIDGNETARKYEVDGKFNTIFDLSNDNIISPKSFKIIDVTAPLYGNIIYDSNNLKVTYTPPKEIRENDCFDIIVQTEGGRIVTLNVNFKLLYRGTYAEVWNLRNDVEPKQSVQQALEEVNGRNPDRIEESNIAGKARFTAAPTNRELYHLRFKFVANQEGLHQFYLKADDASSVTFYRDNENGESIGNLFTTKDVSNYGSNNVEVTLNVNDTLYVDCYLVNWGGPGNLYVGVKFPNSDKIEDIPSNNIINANVTNEELEIADEFKGWQPQFLDSIKDEPIDYKTEKNNWEIIECPVAHINDGQGINALIDNDESTYYHSSYAGNKPPYPHTIIIDCKEEIFANYFEILRRGNQNDKIINFKLYCAKNIVNDLAPNDEDYELLFDGLTEDPNSLKYRINFNERAIRYFKLVIVQTAGQTVIKELTAGRTVSLEQTVRPKNYEQENQGFIENSANGKLTTKEEGSYYIFSFLGTGFDIFADTDLSYGSGIVYVDDVLVGNIDLAEKRIFNKCVFRKHDLEIGNHVVKIETNTSLLFNISFINVDYQTPVEEKDFPTIADDYGDESPLIFSTEWKTIVPEYKELTSIKFLNNVPDGYNDTYLRMNDYIRIYQKEDDKTKIAFVYKGNILSPSECGFLFAGCTNLKEIVFDNFDTTSMRSTISMFSDCNKLQILDLSNFKTNQTLFLSSMFANCNSLTELNLLGLNIKKEASLVDIFLFCSNLNKLHVPNEFLVDGIILPNQFVDVETKNISNELNTNNAGHILLLHQDHSFTEHIALVNPTCLRNGTKEYYLCACGSYSFDGTNETNDNIEIKALGHQEETVKGYDPTCTKSGLTDGTRCAICHEILTKQQEILALGHQGEIVKGYDPTCTKSGLTDGVRCAVCYEILTKQQEIPATGHKEEIIKGYDATCTTPGLTDEVHCSVCHEILEEQQEIPATGHEWGNWEVVKEPTYKEEGLKERKCPFGHVETEIVPMLTKDYNSLIVGIVIGCSVLLIGTIIIIILIRKKRLNKKG